MKITTKYCCQVDRAEGGSESIALFSSDAFQGAMYAFADACLEDERNTNARIVDLDNGEVIYDVQDERAYAEAEREGMYDEMGYNPYMGCYDFDC